MEIRRIWIISLGFAGFSSRSPALPWAGSGDSDKNMADPHGIQGQDERPWVSSQERFFSPYGPKAGIENQIPSAPGAAGADPGLECPKGWKITTTGLSTSSRKSRAHPTGL